MVTRYLIVGVKRAFGLQPPGKRLSVLPDDILLASYPKSGNTWIRFLIANLVYHDREVGFGNLHKLILDPDGTPQRDFIRAQKPRVIKTHGPFDPRFRRVICVVRDPRDVAVSQYHYLRKVRRIGDDCPIGRFVDRFLEGDLARRPGSWGENVGSWLATRHGRPGFLLLRYEDVLADTAHELTRVATFGGFPANLERIAQAVERSSADKMRENEKKQGERSTLIKGSRQDIAFVRSAKSGGWRNDLPEAEVARIEAKWADVMACLGYELVTRSAHSVLDSSLIGMLAGRSGAADKPRAGVFSASRSERVQAP